MYYLLFQLSGRLFTTKNTIIDFCFVLFPELFHTERTHVRNLKVLVHLFNRPMINLNILQPNDINLLFGELPRLTLQSVSITDHLWRLVVFTNTCWNPCASVAGTVTT